MPTSSRAPWCRPAGPRVRSLAVACGLALLPGVATAQSATTPADASVLQAQLRAWFANLLAPAATLPELPLTVTADGDKYRLTLPASTWSGPPGDDVSADLRQVEGGAWSLDALKVPATGAFSTGALGGKGQFPEAAARFQVGGQEFRAVIDPAMRRRSSFSLDASDIVLDMRVDNEKQAQRIERYTIQGAVVPGADGRFDVTQDATVSGWITTADVGQGMSTEMGVRRARVTMRLDGVRSDRLGSAFMTLKELVAFALNDLGDSDKDGQGPDAKGPDGKAPPATGPSAKGPGTTSGVPRPDLVQVGRQKARALIEAMRDFADRVEGDETIDDFTMVLPLVGRVSLTQMQFGMGAEAPDGRLRAWTELSLQGLEAEAIPPTMVDYVPSRVAMRPVISGVRTERIFDLLLRALDENPDFAALQADAMALLASTDTIIGLESLAIDLDPVRLAGSGRLRLFGADKAGIEARVTATGFDALMAEANRKPELKQAAPILLMARGLARPDGDKLVWDLAISDSQALVNGVDVMALQPPAEQKPQPRSNKR